jgi:hypothetical protein
VLAGTCANEAACTGCAVLSRRVHSSYQRQLAAHSLRRMADLLTGPLCGWPLDRVLVVGKSPLGFQRLPAQSGPTLV